jgi:hypothetical protein
VSPASCDSLHLSLSPSCHPVPQVHKTHITSTQCSLCGPCVRAVAASCPPPQPASTHLTRGLHHRLVPPNARDPYNKHPGCSLYQSRACAIAVWCSLLLLLHHLLQPAPSTASTSVPCAPDARGPQNEHPECSFCGPQPASPAIFIVASCRPIHRTTRYT